VLATIYKPKAFLPSVCGQTSAHSLFPVMQLGASRRLVKNLASPNRAAEIG
jgi:hypothetical protein